MERILRNPAETTPWFTGKDLPIRSGWYDTQLISEGRHAPIMRRYFNGATWSMGVGLGYSDTATKQLRDLPCYSPMIFVKWRGLRKPGQYI